MYWYRFSQAYAMRKIGDTHDIFAVKIAAPIDTASPIRSGHQIGGLDLDQDQDLRG